MKKLKINFLDTAKISETQLKHYYLRIYSMFHYHLFSKIDHDGHEKIIDELNYDLQYNISKPIIKYSIDRIYYYLGLDENVYHRNVEISIDGKVYPYNFDKYTYLKDLYKYMKNKNNYKLTVCFSEAIESRGKIYKWLKNKGFEELWSNYVYTKNFNLENLNGCCIEDLLEDNFSEVEQFDSELYNMVVDSEVRYSLYVDDFVYFDNNPKAGYSDEARKKKWERNFKMKNTIKISVELDEILFNLALINYHPDTVAELLDIKQEIKKSEYSESEKTIILIDCISSWFNSENEEEGFLHKLSYETVKIDIPELALPKIISVLLEVCKSNIKKLFYYSLSEFGTSDKDLVWEFDDNILSLTLSSDKLEDMIERI